MYPSVIAYTPSDIWSIVVIGPISAASFLNIVCTVNNFEYGNPLVFVKVILNVLKPEWNGLISTFVFMFNIQIRYLAKNTDILMLS